MTLILNKEDCYTSKIDDMSNTIRKYNRFVRTNNRNYMGDNKLAHKNFNLLESEFNELKLELQSGNEELFKQVFLSHFDYALNYVINKFNAEYNLAYDISMNTLLEFRHRIIKDKVSYGNLNFLFTQMCSQRYQRSMAKNIKKVAISRGVENSIEDNSAPDLSEEMIAHLDKAMEMMGENCQEILRKIYYENLSYNTLESIYNKKAATLRKQKERCMTYLKMLIRKTLNQ